MKNCITIEAIGSEVIFRKDGKIVELNQFGHKALATAIVYNDLKKLFDDPLFKDCDDKILDTFNMVKKEYEELQQQLNTKEDLFVIGTDNNNI